MFLSLPADNLMEYDIDHGLLCQFVKPNSSPLLFFFIVLKIDILWNRGFIGCFSFPLVNLAREKNKLYYIFVKELIYNFCILIKTIYYSFNWICILKFYQNEFVSLSFINIKKNEIKREKGGKGWRREREGKEINISYVYLYLCYIIYKDILFFLSYLDFELMKDANYI